MPNEKESTEELDLSALQDDYDIKKAKDDKIEDSPKSEEAVSVTEAKAIGDSEKIMEKVEAEKAQKKASIEHSDSSKPVTKDTQKKIGDKILSKKFVKTPEIPDGKLDLDETPAAASIVAKDEKPARKSHEKVRMLVSSETEFVSKEALKKAFSGVVGVKNGWVSALINGIPTVIDGTSNACIKTLANKIKGILPRESKTKDSDMYPCAYDLLKSSGIELIELGNSLKKSKKSGVAKKKPAVKYTVVDKNVIGTVIYDSLSDLKKAYRLKGDCLSNVVINGSPAIISAKEGTSPSKNSKDAEISSALQTLISIVNDVCQPKTDKAYKPVSDSLSSKSEEIVTSIYKAAGIWFISL